VCENFTCNKILRYYNINDSLSNYNMLKPGVLGSSFHGNMSSMDKTELYPPVSWNIFKKSGKKDGEICLLH
jgi:translation initiation factor 2 gamma subunit (eIF-2gamma)